MLTLQSEIDPASFKELFRNVPGSVAVVTGTENGQPHATTVSSFASLSMTPAYALVSLDITSRLLPVLERTGRLGINLLAHHQRDIGVQCAGKADDKLADISWHYSRDLPRIDECAGWMAGAVEQLLHVGDHTIIVVRPLEMDTADEEPLLYHRATFHRVGAQA